MVRKGGLFGVGGVITGGYTSRKLKSPLRENQVSISPLGSMKSFKILIYCLVFVRSSDKFFKPFHRLIKGLFSKLSIENHFSFCFLVTDAEILAPSNTSWTLKSDTHENIKL